MKRVAITGMGIISPIGNQVDTAWDSLVDNRSGIENIPAWEKIKDLKVSIAGQCRDYDPKRINRKDRRTMGPMAVMATLTALDALNQAGLGPEQPGFDLISSKHTGVAMGSTTGSGKTLETMFNDFLETGGIGRLEGTAFMKIMNHSVAANVAATLGTRGRVISPCCACATSTQAIGEGYEIIKNGHQKVMICGGADELHPSTAAIFNILNAASKNYCQEPFATPKPFDVDRDGLVVSEGAGTLILEEFNHAQERGATILGEIIGYNTCCDGSHMTTPQASGMVQCMEGALENANCQPAQIDYINAHATGTRLGDVAEAQAIAMLGNHKIPVSATKGYTGHTLAASGVMESIFCLQMMAKSVIIPTRNLDRIDPDCAGICHVQKIIEKPLNLVMTSNFAFGGINATLILKNHQN
ncbi:MAG: beta-ketoacyl-[acyl-carrier-protein] synthase family protein [Desulfobacteraceae bacterium]|nr:beta-ketoacyl-[acyl-carrier-protein] synthase family protein [Desulfobacteraceae bacterium]